MMADAGGTTKIGGGPGCCHLVCRDEYDEDERLQAMTMLVDVEGGVDDTCRRGWRRNGFVMSATRSTEVVGEVGWRRRSGLRMSAVVVGVDWPFAGDDEDQWRRRWLLKGGGNVG